MPANRVIQSRGFTLIELIVVLFFLALTAGIAIPSFGKSIGRYRTQSSAFQAAELLNAARHRAIATSSTVHAQFDAVNNRYTIEDAGAGKARTVDTSLEHGGVTISWALFIHNTGVSMTGVAFDHTGAAFAGDPKNAETLEPLTSGNIGFVLGSHTVRVDVTRATGFVEIAQ